jgi:hypothetical protein
VSGICLFLETFSSSSMQWVWGAFISIFIMLGYCSLLVLLSNAVSAQEQGKIMGNLGALGSLSNLLAAACIGSLSYVFVFLPLLVASLTFLMSGFFLYYFCKEKQALEVE